MNEITFRKHIINFLNANFNMVAEVVANSNGDQKLFSIDNFSAKSLNDAIIKTDQFGLVVVESSDWTTEYSFAQEMPYTNTLSAVIQTIFPSTLDDITQVSIARMALAEICRRKDFADNGKFSVVNIISTDPLDLTAKSANNRYIQSGIKIEAKIGV